jgi:CcmD family protein
MKNLNSLMAAYIAAWAIFFVYHFSVARRLSRLREEVDKLKQSLSKGSRS